MSRETKWSPKFRISGYVWYSLGPYSLADGQFEFFFESSFDNPNIEDFEVPGHVKHLANSQLLAHLKAFKVARDPNEPKIVEFSFTFEPNEYLEDDSLTITKTFHNIQSPESDDEITSVKASLKWKEGKDLTKPVKGASPSFFTWFAFEKLGQEKNVVPDSDNLAVSLADEIYPHAHTIFQDSFVEDEDEFDEDEDEDLESDGNGQLKLGLIIR